jgi:hypothetical protein
VVLQINRQKRHAKKHVLKIIPLGVSDLLIFCDSKHLTFNLALSTHFLPISLVDWKNISTFAIKN